MTKLKAWIHAFRLRTLPLSLSGILVGSFASKAVGCWNLTIFVFALLTTVLFQILSNLANDLGDSQKGADNAQRVGPQRAVQSGVISMREMKIAVGIFSFLSFVSAGILIYVSAAGKPVSFWIFYAVLAVFCVLAAITYTVGKRAYGYHGLGDVFVFVFFGLVSVLGVFHLYQHTFEFAQFNWSNVLPAITIGCLSAAVLNLNNMRDRLNDSQVGKRTIVVLLGGEKAKIYHSLLLIGGLFSFTFYVFQYHPTNKWMMMTFLPQLFLIMHLRKVMLTQEPTEFDPELKKVALSTFALSLLFAIAIQLQLVYGS